MPTATHDPLNSPDRLTIATKALGEIARSGTHADARRLAERAIAALDAVADTIPAPTPDHADD